MPGLAAKPDRDAMLYNEVADRLYDVFNAGHGALASLDQWTQRRILEENMAKLALVLEADDPVEYCYQNLIREIDAEAEMGIYLVGTRHSTSDLRILASDPGISGTLYREIDALAPIVFADILSQARENAENIWITIQAGFDRARIDATVSQMIMAHLQNDGVGVDDMANALRSLMYVFHEDRARRLAGMPLMLNDRGMRELVMMVSELAQRAGNYDRRVEAISDRADVM